MGFTDINVMWLRRHHCIINKEDGVVGAICSPVRRDKRERRDRESWMRERDEEKVVTRGEHMPGVVRADDL